jgi:hypothetical protein
MLLAEDMNRLRRRCGLPEEGDAIPGGATFGHLEEILLVLLERVEALEHDQHTHPELCQVEEV